jgi:hypothetical protein
LPVNSILRRVIEILKGTEPRVLTGSRGRETGVLVEMWRNRRRGYQTVHDDDGHDGQEGAPNGEKLEWLGTLFCEKPKTNSLSI